MTAVWISYALLWLVVLVQGFAFLEVLRQLGVLRKQIGPQQGAALVPTKVDLDEPLPELAGIAADDLRAVEWSDFVKHDVGVAVLLSTHCNTCREIAEDLSGLADELGGEASVLAIVEGPADEVRAFVADTHLPSELTVVDETGETAKRLGITWNPAAISIRDGALGTAAVVNDIYQVDSLVSRELTREPAPA